MQKKERHAKKTKKKAETLKCLLPFVFIVFCIFCMSFLFFKDMQKKKKGCLKKIHSLFLNKEGFQKKQGIVKKNKGSLTRYRASKKRNLLCFLTKEINLLIENKEEIHLSRFKFLLNSFVLTIKNNNEFKRNCRVFFLKDSKSFFCNSIFFFHVFLVLFLKQRLRSAFYYIFFL